MKLFLDANIIIYWVESAEPHYSKCVTMLRNLCSRYPEAQFAASRLSFLECRVKPLRDKNFQLLSKYDQFFHAKDLQIIELTSHVIDIATELRSQSGLRTPDALQVACALSLSLDHDIIFVTGDIRIKNIQGLSISYI
jgi:predicted nucleic acid-binding protein